MAYKYTTSPEPSESLRLVVRLVFCIGALITVWLIAPTAANALEPPTAVNDAITDATADATNSIAAVTTVTEAAEEPTETVTDAADSAATTVTEAAEEPTDTVTHAADVEGRADTDTATKAISSATRDVAGSARDTAASVGDSADDAVSTVENAGDGAADVARHLQNADSTVEPDTMSAVEVIAESVTALVATVPRIDDDDRMAKSGDREDVTSLRFGDKPAFTIRGPPVTTEPIAAAATSDAGAAATPASGGAPNAPPTSDGLPPAMGSTARDFLRDGSSFNDFVAILAAIMIAFGLVRWSSREAELRYSPLFLSLAERPG